MPKTSSQIKNMVEDWVKIVGIRYEDSTQKVKPNNPQVEWQLFIGQALHVTKLINRNDRIDTHWAMRFDEKLSEQLIVGDGNTEKIVGEANRFLIILGLTYNWILKDNHVIGLDVKAYIDEEELNRPVFFKTWDKIVNASSEVGNMISFAISPQTANSTKSGNTASQDMYR